MATEKPEQTPPGAPLSGRPLIRSVGSWARSEWPVERVGGGGRTLFAPDARRPGVWNREECGEYFQISETPRLDQSADRLPFPFTTTPLPTLDGQSRKKRKRVSSPAGSWTDREEAAGRLPGAASRPVAKAHTYPGVPGAGAGTAGPRAPRRHLCCALLLPPPLEQGAREPAPGSSLGLDVPLLASTQARPGLQGLGLPRAASRQFHVPPLSLPPPRQAPAAPPGRTSVTSKFETRKEAEKEGIGH